jgi:Na+-transporting NADH:ubiquinone oxidoreductase subunit NqrF
MIVTRSTSIVLGLVFVLLGGINVWLVLEAWSRVKAAKASARMLALHRMGGYLFIALFCVMAYFMIGRIRAGGGGTSPTADKSIVLIAAGSGITPMMAMLRYIDDLCLATEATLLYCVRTNRDIIFHHELDELRGRIKNFRYDVLLSQPDPEWTGARGHINREFICRAIPEVKGRAFFLCGPPPFMEAARRLLVDLGVEPERIRQETFGGTNPELKLPQAPASETGYQVEFARSGKVCPMTEGQTLLQAAAENGVEIPSACRQGQCGTCKTRLLDGHVRMTAEQGLDPESKGRGFVLTCVGYADGNVKLDA